MHVTWAVYDHSPRIDQAADQLAAQVGRTVDEAIELMKERAVETRRTVEQVAADVIAGPAQGSDGPSAGSPQAVRTPEGARTWE